MTENWKPIPGFEGYYNISDQGHVFSIQANRLVGSDTHGRFNRTQVALWKSNENIKEVRQVSRLVAEAFLPPPETDDAICVLHKNGDYSDNRAENLYWATHKEACSREDVIAYRRQRAAERNGYILAQRANEKYYCEGIRGATEKTGVPKSTVQYALSHNGTTKSGWYFERIKVENPNDWTKE